MTIKLNNPVEIITQPEIKKIITEIQIERIVDRNKEKKVIAFLDKISQNFILWEGDAYDAIGDWTQAQAEARILELLK